MRLKNSTNEYPDGNTKNETDFIIINDMSVVKDVRICKELKFPSDHRLIQAKIMQD